MNNEERYNAALERAKEYHDNGGAPLILEVIFPELKEPEGEKMKKAIRHILYENYTDAAVIEGVEIAEIVAWLEKQGEQNHAHKVEPKFHEGEWISGYYKITAINSKGYVVEDTDGNKINILFENEEFHHLFTIADAKEGDVLVINNEIFIYAHRKQMYSIAVAHCFVNSTGSFYLDGEFGYEEYGKTISPATKEQRDLLFRKMKEAGYEWDSEKKELKKIEKKTLDADKVVEWLHKYWPFSWGNFTLQVDDAIEKFKKDFKL